MAGRLAAVAVNFRMFLLSGYCLSFLLPITFATSRREAPRVSIDLISKSRDTLGSPASIFATLDWLEEMAFAKAACVRRCFFRRSFSALPRISLSSITATSSSDNPRNSAAVPNRQPFVFSTLRLLCRNVIVSTSCLTGFNHVSRCSACFLLEHLQYYDGVRVDSINNSPGKIPVIEP